MHAWKYAGILLASLLLLILADSSAQAARVRLHYVIVDTAGHMGFPPEGAGETVTWFGPLKGHVPTPNQWVTFRHPFTARMVSVPLSLAEGTPRMEYRNDRVVYNYGSYTVEIHFLTDGSVDVFYNSGLLRAL